MLEAAAEPAAVGECSAQGMWDVLQGGGDGGPIVWQRDMESHAIGNGEVRGVPHSVGIPDGAAA